MNDSLGQPDPIAYNAAYWNGNEWILQKITVKFRGNMITAPLEGVCAFSNTDIWFVGSLPIHGDGINWIMYDLRTTLDPNISVSKAWGTSSNDIYFVGRSGSVAHYSNTNWQKIESGTELNIYDIYGQKKTNGEYEIICVASDLFLNQGKKILNIENNNVSTIPDVGLSNSLHTVWFVPGKRYFIGGDGLFSTSSLSENWKRHTELPSYYKDAARGNSSNDIIVIGAFGLLLHYNGNGWKNFQDITYVNGELGRVDINGNVVCAVGYDDNKAIIFIGKRN
jgi:hypothetical protein